MSKIQGTNISAPVVPNDSNDIYPSHHAQYGKGGFRTVATVTDRDAIPVDRRENLMLVAVEADGIIYELKLGEVDQDLSNNSNWVEKKFGSAGGTIRYVADSTEMNNIPASERSVGMMVIVANEFNCRYELKPSGLFETNFSFGDNIIDAETMYNFASGNNNILQGNNNYAEGNSNFISGDSNHAEGAANSVTGILCHAEGQSNLIDSDSWVLSSHVEGQQNEVRAPYAHGQGFMTVVSGMAGHAGGLGVYDDVVNNAPVFVIAGGETAFNHSTMSKDGFGKVGAAADHSAILGGVDNQILSGAVNSVILGGSNITASLPDNVYGQNFYIVGNPTDGNHAVRKNYVDTQINNLVSNLDWKESVPTFNDIASYYPNPIDGWTVSTKDTDTIYRFNGTSWVDIASTTAPHTHQISEVTGLQGALDGKASNSHIHSIANISGLQGSLDAKATTSHNHDGQYLSLSGGSITGSSLFVNATTDSKLGFNNFGSNDYCSFLFGDTSNSIENGYGQQGVIKFYNGTMMKSNVGNLVQIGLSSTDPTVKVFNNFTVDGSLSANNATITNYLTLKTNGEYAGLNYQTNTGANKATIEYNQASNRLDFYTNNGSWLNTMSLTTTNNGSVGIGTLNPGSKFVVANGVNTAGLEVAPATDWLNMRVYSRDASNVSTFKGLQFDASKFCFSSGFVGVGTTTPTQPLHIQQAEAVVRLQANGGRIFDIQSSSASDFRIGDASAGGGVRFLINSAGNVGINTTTPDAKMHIVNNNFSTGVGFHYRGYQNYPNYTTAENFLVEGGWEKADPLVKNTKVFTARAYDDTTGFNILTNGSVGIGTGSPNAKLDVNGEINAGAGALTLSRNLTDQVGRRNWALDTEFASVGDFNISESTANNTRPSIRRLTILSGGNVGIGTDSPTTKLQVRGGAFQVINGVDPWSSIHLDAGPDSPKVGFRVSDNSERFRIQFMGVNGGSNERLAIFEGLGDAEHWSINKFGVMSVSSSIVAGGDITSNSDAKLKDNVRPIENPLSIIESIRGVRFERNDLNGITQVGVIAQEVKEVLPEIVHYNETTDTHSVAYDKLTSVLIEAVKELSAKVEDLERRLNQ